MLGCKIYLNKAGYLVEMTFSVNGGTPATYEFLLASEAGGLIEELMANFSNSGVQSIAITIEKGAATN